VRRRRRRRRRRGGRSSNKGKSSSVRRKCGEESHMSFVASQANNHFPSSSKSQEQINHVLLWPRGSLLRYMSLPLSLSLLSRKNHQAANSIIAQCRYCSSMPLPFSPKTAFSLEVRLPHPISSSPDNDKPPLEHNPPKIHTQEEEEKLIERKKNNNSWLGIHTSRARVRRPCR
jgi:hypothetical protein